MRKYNLHKKTVITQKIQSMMYLMHTAARQEENKTKKFKKIKALRLYPKEQNTIDSE